VRGEYPCRQGFITYANGDDINGALAFIKLAVIPSYKCADLGFINLIISSISLEFVFFNINFGKGLKNEVYRYSIGLLSFPYPYLSSIL
jgi:hypothetical protein